MSPIADSQQCRQYRAATQLGTSQRLGTTKIMTEKVDDIKMSCADFSVFNLSVKVPGSQGNSGRAFGFRPSAFFRVSDFDLRILFCALLLLLLAATPRAHATSQQLYLQCLTNFETYAESIWHTASYSGAPPDAGYWG